MPLKLLELSVVCVPETWSFLAILKVPRPTRVLVVLNSGTFSPMFLQCRVNTGHFENGD